MSGIWNIDPVMYKILSEFSVNELASLRLVCKRWEYLIECLLKTRRNLVLAGSFDIHRSQTIMEFDLTYSISVNDIVDIGEWKGPNLLSSASFQNFLLKSFKNLTTLIFWKTKIHYIQFLKLSPLWQDNPNFRHFGLIYSDFNTDVFKFSDYFRLLSSVKHITLYWSGHKKDSNQLRMEFEEIPFMWECCVFGLHFPNYVPLLDSSQLRMLKYYPPIRRSIDSSTSNKVDLDRLGLANAINCAKVVWGRHTDIMDSGILINGFRNLQSLEIENLGLWRDYGSSLGNLILKLPKLTSFALINQMTTFMTPVDADDMIIGLTSTAGSKLRHLKIGAYRLSHESLNAIARFCSHLKELELAVFPEYPPEQLLCLETMDSLLELNLTFVTPEKAIELFPVLAILQKISTVNVYCKIFNPAHPWSIFDECECTPKQPAIDISLLNAQLKEFISNSSTNLLRLNKSSEIFIRPYSHYLKKLENSNRSYLV